MMPGACAPILIRLQIKLVFSCSKCVQEHVVLIILHIKSLSSHIFDEIFNVFTLYTYALLVWGPGSIDSFIPSPKLSRLYDL